jgi:hypothetical protein
MRYFCVCMLKNESGHRTLGAFELDVPQETVQARKHNMFC